MRTQRQNKVGSIKPIKNDEMWIEFERNCSVLGENIIMCTHSC